MSTVDLSNPDSISQTDFQALTAAQIQQISTSALAGLDQNHYQWLTASQIAAMLPQQIAALAHPDLLSPAAVAGLTATQMPSISISLSWMNAAWINALSPSAFAAIALTGISQISSAATSGINAASVVAMTQQQIAALNYPQNLSTSAVAVLTPTQVAAINGSDWNNLSSSWFNALSPAAAAALTPTQVTAVTVSQWGGMSAAMLYALSPAAFAAIPLAGINEFSGTTTAALSANAIAAMTLQQIAGLQHADMLSPAAVGSLTAVQAAAISTSWYWMSSAWVDALSASAVAGIPLAGIGKMTAQTTGGLSAAIVAAMTTQQIAALRVDLLSPAAAAALSPTQVAAVTVSQWGGMSMATLNALSPAAFAAIPLAGISEFSSTTTAALSANNITAMTPQQIAGLQHADLLSPAAVGSLTAAQTAAIAISWSWMSPAWVDALSASAVAGITPANISNLTAQTTGGLSAAIVAAMTTQQIAALRVDLLSPAAAAALSPTQVAAVTVSQWGGMSMATLNALSPAAFAAIPLAGINEFSSTTTAALSANNITAMTPQQIAGLQHADMLSPAAVGSLTAAQTAAIAISWSWMSPAWVDALSASAVAGITPANISNLTAQTIAGLSAAIVAAMTPEQIAGLQHADLLSPAAVGSLTAAQAAAITTSWYWMSPAWVDALSASAVAGISLANISNLTTQTTAGLSAAIVAAMTPQQIAALTHPSALSLAAVSGLTAAQLPVLAIQWSKVNAAWLDALSPSAFAAIPPTDISALSSSTIQGFTAANIAAMTPQQIAAMPYADQLSNAVVSSLSAAQVALINSNWGSMSADWLNSLSLTAFAAIPAAGINQFTLAANEGLDSAHLALAMPNMNATELSYLTPVQMGASGNNPMTYDTVLGTLQQFDSGIGSNGLTSSQLSSFTNLVAAVEGVDGSKSYVGSLMNSMLNSGIGVGTSAAQFTSTLDQWFLGTDNPAINSGASYTSVAGQSLFSNVPNAYLNNQQGQIGDCWLLSGLNEMAAIAPSRLGALIGNNGNGTYAVQFEDGSSNNPVFVTVNSQVASYSASGPVSWESLVETAYVEAASEGSLTGNGQPVVANAYTSIGGGYCPVDLQTLTGNACQVFNSNRVSLADWTGSIYNTVSSALESGSALVEYASQQKSFGSDGKQQLVIGHAFAVIGIDPTNGDYIFSNPWGASSPNASYDGTFDISATQLYQTLGSGGLTVSSLAPTGSSGATAASNSNVSAQTDSLVQAMATFNVPAAAVTSGSGPLLSAQLVPPMLAAAH